MASKIETKTRNSTLKRNLGNVQTELSPYEKLFSKFLHIPSVEYLSEASANTLGRPSGLLFGGAFLFVTSLAMFFLCNYLGYEYNYLIGLLGFPVGFAVGIAGEFFSKFLKKRSR